MITPVFEGIFSLGGVSVERYDEVKKRWFGNLSASRFIKAVTAGVALVDVFPLWRHLGHRQTVGLSSGMMQKRTPSSLVPQPYWSMM